MKRLLSIFVLMLALVATLCACSIPQLGGGGGGGGSTVECQHENKSTWQITTEPTCTADGIKTRKCLAAGCDYEETAKVTKLGHDLVKVAGKDATCTEDGYTAYDSCSRCDYATESQTIDAYGHTPFPTWTTDLAATCYSEGLKSKKCSVCGESTESATIDMKSHKYGSWSTTTPPTCTEAGVKTRSCTNEGCEHSETAAITAIGHDMDEGEITTDPTCTEDGVMTYTCLNGCGHTETEAIDAIGHDMGDFVVTTEPTCSEEGVKTATCNNGCGHTETEAIDTVDHEMGEWYDISDKKQQRDCANCDYYETQNKPPLPECPHAELSDWVTVTEPTCTDDGLREKLCLADGCGYSETEAIDAIGHDMDDGEITTAPTCTEDGVKTYTCLNGCGHTETEAIDAIGHDMGDFVVTTEPTCTEEGVKTATCNNGCGHTETESIPTVDHEMGEWYDISDEEQQRDCANCDYYETKNKPITYGDEYIFATGDMGASTKLVAGKADVITNKHLIFTAQVDSFSGLRVGHGYNIYCASYIEIDSTSVRYYFYTSSVQKLQEVSHGLTIEDNIKVTIDVNSRRVATIAIESNGQTFSFTTGTNWYGSNGEIYAQSLGSVLTNASVAFTCDGYSEDIHFYGDSYLSQSSDRWLMYAFNEGHTEALFDGYGGRGSGGAIASLIENLKHSTPRVVVWMLGMNDGSDINIDAPSSAWITGRDRLIELSEEYGFDIIFTTIPTVPGINHEAKNKWIRESGYRYIDMAAGVGADGTGAWTAGYLYSDNVHPSVEGAKAIYRQVKIDFPEFILGCYHYVADWTYTEEPTCTEGGERTGSCVDCGTVITEAVSALGHDMDEGEITTAPTCTEEGSILFTCQRCSLTATESIDPLGHAMTDSEVVTPPTCSAEGVMSSVCENCGETVITAIDMLKHNVGGWVTVESGARERGCSECDYKETDYIINFSNGFIQSNDRITFTVGAASSGAAAPDAVGPESTVAGSIGTKLEIRDNVAGKVGNFVLYVKVDPTKASSYGATTAIVDLTNDNTDGSFLLFEMEFNNGTYTNSGGPVLFSVTIGANVFNVYPKYNTGGNYGTGLNFGIGGRNILYNKGAYTYTPDGDTSSVLPFGEWVTLRLLFDIEAGELKTFVKSSKTGNIMTLVATTTTSGTIATVGDVTNENSTAIRTTGLSEVTSAKITFNNAVGGVNSSASENYYDNISFMRMDYAECPHSSVSDWATVAYPDCDEEGRRERYCLEDGCGYVEKQFIEALGHEMGAWQDIGNNRVQRDCNICDYYEIRDDSDYVPSADLMSLKGGANSAVVLIHDDGYVASMEFADRMFTKYNLVGDVAMLVDNVMNGSNYRDAYIPFQYYLSNGNWGLINHSYTHSYWGTIQYAEDGTTVIGVTPDEAKIYREVVTAAEKLRELFPGHRVLTFAYPGISKISNPLGNDVLYREIRKVVEQYCIAGRKYMDGAQNITDITWDMTDCGTLTDANAESVIKSFEDFAYGESKLSVYLTHGIADGQNTNINGENFEAVCAALATYVEAGTIWNAHYEDAALYLREAETATLTVSGNIDEIKITLTDTLDDEIYNFPLTVRLEVPYGFAAVKVVQGDNTTYAIARDADGKWVVDVDIVPDGGEATVTKIAIADIPEADDEPTVTPPADDEEEEDDGFVINASTDFSTSANLTTDAYSSIVENFDAIRGSVVKYEKATNASGSGRNTSWVPSSQMTAEAMEATFDIYFDKAGTVANGMAFQVYFDTVSTTPFTAVIKTEANGFSFGALSSANGGSTTYCTSSLAYDTWHTITIRINMSSNEHFKATFIANGVEIGSSKVFTNYNKVSGATVNKTVRGIYFQSNSSAKSLMYLDNMSIKAGTLEAMGLPRHGEYHFESTLQNVANSTGFLTPSLSKIGENMTQSLKLVKQLGEDRIGFYPNLNTDPIAPDAFAVSFEMYLDESATAASAGKLATIYFNSVSDSTPFTLDVVRGEDGFVFDGDVATSTAISYGEWHKVKLLVNNTSEEDFKAMIYVDGVLAGESTERTISGFNKSIDGVYFSADGSSTFEMYLDNLTFKTGDKLEIFEVYEKYGIDVNYFPGWTRKSLTFTLDDGILAEDERVLNVLRPAGILGTFNLYNVNVANAEKYRELYEGYGIANHCNYHANFFVEGVEYNIVDEVFPGASTADTSKVYKHATVEGLYYYFISGYSWHPITDVEHYLQFAMQTEAEIEEIFGEGVVKGFIYPNGTPSDSANKEAVVEFLKENGYTNIRRTYPLATDFSIPEDKYNWSYNADHTNFLSKMKAYDALADDGELKMFSFGVHAKDYLKSDAREGSRTALENLYIFARTYGYRPDDFYYATVEQIFEYEEAVKAITVTETSVINNSDITVYIKANGKNITIAPFGEYNFVRDEFVTDAEEPACQHSEMSDWDVISPATCTEAGERVRSCLNAECDHTESEILPALGHTAGNAATCTANQTCTVCGVVLASATGHNMGNATVIIAPTCHSTGKETSTCLNGCGRTETSMIPMLEHSLGDPVVITEPTCIFSGETISACVNDGCSYTLTDHPAPLGHDWSEYEITIEPSCTQVGEKARHCQRAECGMSESFAVPMTECDGPEATCTTKQICSVCGRVLAPATGHRATNLSAVDPTCTESGLTAGKKCSVCDATIIAQQVIPATGHTMSDWVNLGNGTAERECTDCGHVETKDAPVSDGNIDNGGWT